MVACAAMQTGPQADDPDPDRDAPEEAPETGEPDDQEDDEVEPPEIAIEPVPEEEDEARRPLAERLDVDIATWPESRGAAVSFTFDDGTQDHYSVAAPILDTYDVKATFYIISDLMSLGYWDDTGIVRELMSWSQAAELAEAGHEIGGHSATHLDLSLPGTDLSYEVEDSRERIEQQLPGVRVDTFSWPFWRSTAEGRVFAEQSYLAARGGAPLAYRSDRSDLEPASLEERYDIDSLGLLPIDFRGRWEEAAEEVIDKDGWLVFSLHGVRADGMPEDQVGWEAIEAEQLIEMIEFFRERDVWIAPFRDVTAYKLHRKDAEITVREIDETSAGVTAEGDPEAEHVDRPLTLLVQAEDGLECSESPNAEGSGRVEVNVQPGEEVIIECSEE